MQRIKIEQILPDSYKAMLSFSRDTRAKSITPVQIELIKIRASQINGCAFCLNMHAKDAKKLGENDRRLLTLSTWKDTPYFSDEERAILSLTEEITLIPAGVTDLTYSEAAKVLSEVQIAEVIMTAVAINGWNRIIRSTNVQPAD